jgi:glycosyltransferase involved in cell wall biosynthesis
MNVLFISHEATRTGAPIALLQELQYICSHCKQIEPSVYFIRGGELLGDFEQLCPIYKGWIDNHLIKRLFSRFDFPDRWLLHVFQRKKFDCIYANSVVSFEKGLMFKNKLGVRLIGHVHEAECLMQEFHIEPALLANFDQFITVSKLAAENLINHYAVPSEQVFIQHPVSLWVSRLLKKEISVDAYDYHEDAKLIGCFCNAEWAKATDVIPLFLHRFIEKYPEQHCKLVLIGNMSHDYSYLLDYVLRKMNLRERVIFVGGVDNPLNYIAPLDMLLLLSREESFGLAAQEAAIMGKPIIGFLDATGAAEWISQGAGLLVPFMDLGKMADAVNTILFDEKLKEKLGSQAKAIVEEMYENDSKMENVICVVRKNH